LKQAEAESKTAALTSSTIYCNRPTGISVFR
jgi:hypothetical protein